MEKIPSSLSEYFILAEKALKIENLLGNKYVLSDGLILPGMIYGLHKYDAEIDLLPDFHMHMERFGIIRLNENRITDTLYNKPVYTLDGLQKKFLNKNGQEK